MNTRIKAFVEVVFALALVASPLGAAKDTTKIFVGANILVSKAELSLHREMSISVDPRNPLHALVTATSGGEPGVDAAESTQAYASVDGGFTYHVTRFYGREHNMDEDVAYGPSGEAYFVDLDAGDLFTSTDFGLTWGEPIHVPSIGDHPQMIVDTQPSSPYRGRIYIATLGSQKQTHTLEIFLLRGKSNGREFLSATPIASSLHPFTKGMNESRPVISHTGDVYIPFYISAGKTNAPKNAPGVDNRTIYVAVSKDGGASFAHTYLIGRQIDTPVPGPHFSHMAAHPGFSEIVMAIDTTSGPYAGSLYAVWYDRRTSRGRIEFLYSRDGGKHWIEHTLSMGSGAEDGMANVAVNNKGVVGVNFLESETREWTRFREMVTASLDGGQSFLSPVKVSSEDSMIDQPPLDAVALAPELGEERLPQKAKNVSENLALFNTTYPDRATGADYTGLVSDSYGHFHLLWDDSRSGIPQVYTAVAIVGKLTIPTQLSALHMVDTDVELQNDSGSYDPVKHTYALELRLQNRSSHTLFPPLTADFTKILSFCSEEPLWQRYLQGKNLQFLNSRLDFSGSLGSLGMLPPHATTDPLVLKIILPTPQAAGCLDGLYYHAYGRTGHVARQ